MKIKFHKIQASGNDFVVVLKNHLENLDESSFADLARRACVRKTGIGADGFIVLDKINEKELKWFFFNSDGSSAEMCGNASRAVAKFFVEKLNGSKISKLLTLGGEVELQYLDATKIKVMMPKLECLGAEGNGFLYNTGVPHYVFEKDLSNLEELAKFAITKRFPESLDEKGANVSFWHKSGSEVKAISFERGVEAFTLACGTGACACALDVLRSENKENGLVNLNLPGGSVQILKENQSIYLIGDAKVVFSGEWEI